MSHTRRKSLVTTVGGIRVGGPNPIVVQSMTNTDTADIAGTVVRLNSYVPVVIDGAMVAEEQDVLRRFVAADAIGKMPDVSAALDSSFDTVALR